MELSNSAKGIFKVGVEVNTQGDAGPASFQKPEVSHCCSNHGLLLKFTVF